MPDRLIREGIITSDRVNTLTWACEVFYRRLQSLVDDYGRYDGRPSIIRANAYQLKLNQVSEADVVKWLDECSSAGLISFYEVENKKYLLIMNFNQRKKFMKSEWPPPLDKKHIETKKSSSPEVEEKRREEENEKEERENMRTHAREIIFDKLFLFLKKRQKKYFPAERIKWENEFKKLSVKNLKEDDFEIEDKKIFENILGKPIKKEIEKFLNHYEKQGFKTSSGMPIVHWESAMASWMDKCENIYNYKKIP